MSLSWIAAHTGQIYGTHYTEGVDVNTSTWDWPQLNHAITHGQVVVKAPAFGARLVPFAETSPLQFTFAHTISSASTWEQVLRSETTIIGSIPSWTTVSSSGALTVAALDDSYWYSVALDMSAASIANGQYIGSNTIAGISVSPRVTGGICHEVVQLEDGAFSGDLEVLAQTAGAVLNGVVHVRRIAHELT